MTGGRQFGDDEALAARAGYPQLTWVPSTDSTNADLRTAAIAGAPAGTVLVADHQAAGRGRQGRTWTAPPGTSIAMSVLFRPPPTAASRWTWLPLITGMAVVDGLTEVADGVDFRLKWPNDVLAGDRKLCGILAERVETSDGPACVLGLGINLGMSAADLPVPTATSLALLLGGRPQPEPRAVVESVLRQLRRRYDAWAVAADLTALAAEYRARSQTLGRRVRVLLGRGAVVEGIARDVDADGRLLVATAAGIRAFSAGDVEHLR